MRLVSIVSETEFYTANSSLLVFKCCRIDFVSVSHSLTSPCSYVLKLLNETLFISSLCEECCEKFACPKRMKRLRINGE